METTQTLLYNLNMPLVLFDTLRDYYYIPDGAHEGLLETGTIQLYMRGGYRKRRIYKGTLKRYLERPYVSNIGWGQVHVFYRPRLTRMQRMMLALYSGLEREEVGVKEKTDDVVAFLQKRLTQKA